MSRNMQVPYKAYVTASLQTDLFLVYIYIFFSFFLCFFFVFFCCFFFVLFFLCVCERKAFPAQGRSDVNWFLVIGLDTPTEASF